MQLSYGSDGFRGIIGHSFTRTEATRVALGVCRFLQKHHQDELNKPIPVGYDTRFMARDFAEYLARVLAIAGLKPCLAHRACPTPYLAYATHKLKAPIGLQLTASHNPPGYLGIKLKGQHGGSIYPDDATSIELLAGEVAPELLGGRLIAHTTAALPQFNFEKDYCKALLKAARLKGRHTQLLSVDYMHGAASDLYGSILASSFKVNTELRESADPLFGGIKPEPLASQLGELIHRITYDGNESIGLAFDADGDRLAVIDESGRFLATHEIFCLLLEHMVKHHEVSGPVVTTVSFSGLVAKVAASHDVELIEVPVGFKHVSREMAERSAYMGGEESGGTGFAHHLPERDALLMALLLLNARLTEDQPLSALVDNLYARFGKPHYLRRDVPIPAGTDFGKLKELLHSWGETPELAGDEVSGLNHRDGIKKHTAHGWSLTRPSGTEPLFRFYVEADSAERADNYLAATLAALDLG